MRISVLIVSYQRPQPLTDCLRALGRQTRLPDEVIVVGVKGDEVTARTVQQFAADSAFPYLWLSSSQPGMVAQTNRGLEICGSDVVAFTDDDAAPLPDWLQRIEPHYEDETVGGVGGRDLIHLPDGRIWEGQTAHVGHITWLGRLYGNHHLGYPQAVDVDVLKGVNMSYRRSLLGPLDSRLVGGGRWYSDLDASLQVRRAGKRLVFDPQICVDHFPGPRPAVPDPEFVYMASHNLTLNLAKHFDPWRRLAFLAYTFLWGDFPEMGLAIFFKTYLYRLVCLRDSGFIRLLGPCLRGKIDALRALRTHGPSPEMDR